MKKILTLFLTVLTASSLFGAGVGWKKYNINMSGFPKNAIGEIVQTDGDADIIRNLGKNIDGVKKGNKILKGDALTQFKGQTTIQFVDGSTLIMREGSKLTFSDEGIGEVYGNVDFKSGNKTSKLNTEYAKIESKNSEINVKAKENIYDPKPDSVFAVRSNTLVKVPKGVQEFDIYYENSGKQLNANRFTLKEGELATFDDEKVTISTPGKKKPKPPLERKRERRFLGVILSGAYVARDMQGQTFNKKEQKLVGRIGFNYLYMTRRTEPMSELSYTTDPLMDELRISYIKPVASKFAEYIYDSTPYTKYTLGMGNTFSDSLSPTHTSLGFGGGLFTKINSYFLFVDINYKKRFWKFDRFGEWEKWDENELSLETNLVYRFR